MPNKKYNRGAYYERQTIQRLELENYCCYRMAGSHGAYDVIAYNNNICRLIQVKSTQKRAIYTVYKKDLFNIFSDNVPVNFFKELWVYGIVNERKGVLKICVL